MPAVRDQVAELCRVISPEAPGPIVAVFGSGFNDQDSFFLQHAGEPHGEAETGTPAANNDHLERRRHVLCNVPGNPLKASCRLESCLEEGLQKKCCRGAQRRVHAVIIAFFLEPTTARSLQ